jgi:ATP-binding protein involved in chromosome partitioning
MFNKVNIPILGMVQNMSTFICTNCGHNHDIFGLDGAKNKCGELGIRFLGDVPLHPSICSDADAGKPTMVANPDGPQAQAFAGIAKELTGILSL